MIGFFIGLIVGLPLIAVGYYWFDSKRNGKTPKVSFKVALGCFMVGLIISIGAFNSAIDSILNSNKSETKQTTKTVKNKTNKKADTKTSSKKTTKKAKSKNLDKDIDIYDFNAKQIKKLNQQLDFFVTDDQKSAKTDSRWEFANYIESIKYDKQKGFIVYVVNEFSSLSIDNKNTVAEGTQGLIWSAVAASGKEISPDDQAQGNYLNFHIGNSRIGHSKFFNHQKYSWK